MEYLKGILLIGLLVLLQGCGVNQPVVLAEGSVDSGVEIPSGEGGGYFFW